MLDSEKFGDIDVNTLGHISESVEEFKPKIQFVEESSGEYEEYEDEDEYEDLVDEEIEQASKQYKYDLKVLEYLL